VTDPRLDGSYDREVYRVSTRRSGSKKKGSEIVPEVKRATTLRRMRWKLKSILCRSSKSREYEKEGRGVLDTSRERRERKMWLGGRKREERGEEKRLFRAVWWEFQGEGSNGEERKFFSDTDSAGGRREQRFYREERSASKPKERKGRGNASLLFGSFRPRLNEKLKRPEVKE